MGKLKKGFSRLAEALKKNKKLELAVYGGLMLLVLALFLPTLGGKGLGKNAAKEQQSITVTQSEMEIEQRLEQALCEIRGAGRVEVMITYDTGTQLVPALNLDSQQSSSSTAGSAGETVSTTRTESQKPVTTSQNGTEPLVLAEKQPEIRGVIIIAEGAANISVRMNLQSAAQTVLGVSAERVNVYEMKNNDKESVENEG